MIEPNQSESEIEVNYKFKFTGSGSEYFRIWIVNVFLTVITLGIYLAWARVRTRQYFYANTFLADSSFEYLAKPRAILIGNAIILAAFALYSFSTNFNPGLAGFLVILYYILFPYVLYKALCFKFHKFSLP